MKTTKQVRYSCGHVVEEPNEMYQVNNNAQEVILRSPDQVFTNGEPYCQCDDNVCHCNEEYILYQQQQNQEQVQVQEQEDPGIYRTQKTGPIRVLIPLPENQIEGTDYMCFPAEREQVEEIEEIVEQPKPFEVVPENIDFMTLLAQPPVEKVPIHEITPSEKLEIPKNLPKQPYTNTEIVNNPSELFERVPSNWNETNEENLATKLQIKRPFRVPWNQTNEEEKAVKMRIKAPKKPTWNELNQENQDERFNIDAQPEPELVKENFDMLFPDHGRKFKVVEPDDEGEVNIEGKEKIFEMEGQEGGEVMGGYRPDWNRDCCPENNCQNQYRGVPKPDFEETKESDFPIDGIPFSLNWNEKNQEEAPLSMLLPGRPKPIVIVDQEPYFEPGKPKDWNDYNQKQRAMHINYDKTRILQDFDMIKEQDFHLPENDNIIVNDDYNTCDANIVRPVKAIISKINEGTESEDIQDIDVLEGVTRQELQKYGEVLQPYGYNYNTSEQPQTVLKAGPKKSKKVTKPQQQQYQTNFNVPSRRIKRSGVEELRDDNYNLEI